MLAAVLVGAVAIGAGSATAADPAARTCFDGAWRSLQTDSGATFDNQGSCLKYAKAGGVLYSPKLIVVSTCSLYLGLTGTGFHPNSQLTLTLDGGTFAATGTNKKTSGPTDAQGTFIISPVVASATPPVTVRVTDAAGVSATGTALFAC